jgi:hypothetical protein
VVQVVCECGGSRPDLPLAVPLGDLRFFGNTN